MSTEDDTLKILVLNEYEGKENIPEKLADCGICMTLTQNLLATRKLYVFA